MNTEERVAEATDMADELADMIRPVFIGVEPEIIGAVLGQLLATLIAGHHPELRETVLEMVIEMTRNLIPMEIEEMIEQGRCGPEWREATKP